MKSYQHFWANGHNIMQSVFRRVANDNYQYELMFPEKISSAEGSLLTHAKFAEISLSAFPLFVWNQSRMEGRQ